MGFLAPFFFVALGALAIPVVIHLIQRERKEALKFPSLMFLRQVPYKSTRRRKIRNWPLFLARCLAIILLVAAFARPFLERDAAAAGALATSREVVLLLDRSYSMGYGDRWQRALAAANAMIGALGAEDRATIVFFDEGAAAALQSTTDPVRLRAALDGVEPGSGGTRYAPALKLAQSILANSDKPRLEAVLISDFQRNAWDGQPGVRLPAGATLTPVNVGDAVTANLSVTSVTFRREYVGDRERVTATARLTNKAADPAADVPVALELAGRVLETKTADIRANDAVAVEFAPFTLAQRNQRGTVRTGGDALAADDAFHFVLSPGQAIPVLVVDGGGERTSLFLQRALSIGDHPGYRLERRASGQLRASDVTGRAIVVLNDAPFPGGEVGRRLRAFVEGGGGLIIALGERAGTEGGEEAAALMPGTAGRPLDRDGGGASLGYVDYSHPVFEVFRAPRSGDFTAARFFRYRPVEPAADARVLARFDDGAPALLERRVGEGKVLLFSSTFDTYWNTLALQAIYLPFAHQLARYAASYAEPSPWFTAGQVLDIARWQGRGPAASDTAVAAGEEPVAAEGEYIAIAPSGERATLGDERLLRLEEQGFYSVRAASGGDARDFAVAVNLDLAESDLAALDPQVLVAA
ncbi:MAG: vWA domain-containing protein, partial [Longimicrobiales bacterium]